MHCRRPGASSGNLLPQIALVHERGGASTNLAQRPAIDRLQPRLYPTALHNRGSPRRNFHIKIE